MFNALLSGVLGLGAAVALAQMPSNGQYAQVNGIRMYYEVHGNGKPLVLIHGGGSTITTSFGRILPMLRKDFQVIAVELQGHGHTTDRDAPESFAQDADDVAALLGILHIPSASFFGFSNGGNTAMQIAIRHPAIVEKLVLASSFYRREGLVPGSFEGLEKASLHDMPRPLQDAFLKVTPDSGKLLTMFMKDRDRMLRFVDWKDELVGSIKAPALIINGDRDIVQAAHAVALSRVIQNSRLLILPATHGSYIGTAETIAEDSTLIELTVDVVKRFLLAP